MVYRARVYFLTTSEGGLQAGPWDTMRVPMWIGGEYLDCLITLPGPSPHALGQEYDVSVDFLCPEFAAEAIAKGRAFELRAGKTIARGEILAP